MHYVFVYSYNVGKVEIAPELPGYAEIAGTDDDWWISSIHLYGHRYDETGLAMPATAELHDGDGMHHAIRDWLRDDRSDDIEEVLCLEGRGSYHGSSDDEHRTHAGRL